MTSIDGPTLVLIGLILAVFCVTVPTLVCIVICMGYQRLGAVLRELKKLNGGR